MTMFNLADYQMEIDTLEGEHILFLLEEVRSVFPDDGEAIPCVLSSPQILIPGTKETVHHGN